MPVDVGPNVELPAPREAGPYAELGLTPAELRIAIGISRGKSVAELACIYGISVKTARTQLKAAFAKTGTHRQAQLAALIFELTGSAASAGAASPSEAHV